MCLFAILIFVENVTDGIANITTTTFTYHFYLPLFGPKLSIVNSAVRKITI